MLLILNTKFNARLRNEAGRFVCLFREFVFVRVDDFCHEHFAADVRVESVDAQAGFELQVILVVEVRLEVNVVFLFADEFVDFLHLRVPVRIAGGTECRVDVHRMNRHECEENRTDAVCLAFYAYDIQIRNY